MLDYDGGRYTKGTWRESTLDFEGGRYTKGTWTESRLDFEGGRENVAIDESDWESVAIERRAGSDCEVIESQVNLESEWLDMDELNHKYVC